MMMLFEDPTYLIIVFALFAILNIITIRDILKNKNLTKRQKNNYVWLQFGLPIIGSIIYFSEKGNKPFHLKK